MENQRNFLLAAVLSLGVVFLWQLFIINPRLEQERLNAERAAVNAPATPGAATPGAATPGVPAASNAPSGASAVPGATAQPVLPEKQTPRIQLSSERLEGSINLRGARIDDLRLREYREEADDNSPLIQLLHPVQDENAYFAELGFSPDAALGDLPGPTTIWTQIGSGELTPTTPVTLEFKNANGLTFLRTIAVDTDYMFTITDKVTNSAAAPVAIKPYGRITRYGKPETAGIYVLHEGLIGSVGEQGLDEIDYDEVEDDGPVTKEKAEKGWLGITDKYWATALVPGQTFTAHYSYFNQLRPFYQADYLGDPVQIAAGGETTITNQVFAGAKKVDIIDKYEAENAIPLFSNLIDWGWFYFLTKPLFALMNWVFNLVGNFGVTILIVTVLIKIVFFPLANKSYASMANMKKMQPEMAAIRERFSDDRQAQQKAMMELYKKEKINPAAGCWPVLIQIPVFFALYKVIYVTIEMRHAPFFGWIQDLSAPDPTSFLNLFGLLPYESPAFLAILAVGVWPLIMGITMFIQMQMNPAPPDPTQQMIFKWMPVIFTFMLATFPAGLVIYWAWNNFLSILQQGAIMKRQGAKIELWDNLKSMFAKKGEAES